MKIIVSIDKFKGSISSIKLNSLVTKILKKKNISTKFTCIPISDGGDGFLETIENLF